MDERQRQNASLFTSLSADLKQKLEQVYLGGGEKKQTSHKAKGKMTARERIAYLVDDMSDFLEVGTLTADGMYEEWGGCPSAGVIVGIGKISGRQCVIAANDATVKAGAWFPMTAKKKS